MEQPGVLVGPITRRSCGSNPTPAIYLNMVFYIGIDEAGRGPVIGPMAFCGVLADEKQIKLLKMIDVKDSKLLLPKKREFLSLQIKKNVVAYSVSLISPEEIDRSLEEKINLNQLEAIKAAEIINLLLKRVDKAEVIIDCPSTNILSWSNYLLNFVKTPEKIKLRCEHKADLNYTVVGAASIMAKVSRDAEIEKIKSRIGENFGSGYPSDPMTVEFLKKNWQKFEDAGIFRKSWQTWKDVALTKKQKKLLDF